MEISKIENIFDTFLPHLSATIIRYSGIEVLTAPNNRTIIWMNVVKDRALENMRIITAALG